MSLPPYIELPGSSTSPQPFSLVGVNSQTFLLRASYDRLTKVTDQWLNSVPGSEWKFVPLLPYVICTPTWIDRIYPAEQKGWVRETDFNFAILVAAFRVLELDRICVAFPYLIVDNPVPVILGREIYGFRKVQGPMEYVSGTYQPQAAFTWVRKSADSEYELEEVVRIISPAGWPHATARAKWDDLKAVAEVAVGDLVMDIGVGVEHLITMLKTLSVPYVYLLELRDVQFPASAAYQALIESPLQITKFKSAWMLPPGFSIKLTDYPTYPLISDLGIEVDADNVAKSHFSFQTNYDCILQTGKVLAVGGRTTPS